MAVFCVRVKILGRRISMNIERIINSKGLCELLAAIDDFCRESYLRDDDSSCMELKQQVEIMKDNDIMNLLYSYLFICEDGDEVIEALYEFVENCRAFAEADEDVTHQVTNEEFEAVLDECEDKCELKSCIEMAHKLIVAEADGYCESSDLTVRFKHDFVNVILPKIDINTDVPKYISEQLGSVLYMVLKNKLSPEYIEHEMKRYIPETRKMKIETKELFKRYFYEVILYKERKPGIYTEFDDHWKRVIVLEFFKRMISEYLKE